MHHNILLTASTIQEKIDAIPGVGLSILIIFSIVFGFLLISVITERIVQKARGNKEPALLGSIVGSVLFVVAVTLFVSSYMGKQNDLEEAMKENVLENIDIHEVKVDLLRNNNHRATVLGVHGNNYIEFDVIYNEKDDLMMPVHGGNQHVEIPVKEGSQLKLVTQ